MQQLTPAQKHLILGLQIMGCSEETTLGIMLLLVTPGMLRDMMDWMVENRNATEPELFSKAVDTGIKISRLGNPSGMI